VKPPREVDVDPRLGIPPITISGFMLDLLTYVGVRQTSDGGPVLVEVEIAVRMDAPDRDTGVVRAFAQNERHLIARDRLVAEVPRRVRDLVREAVTHEIDEQLLVDGKRRFDPHVYPRAT
jgi:hypothetical protein